MRRLVTLLRPVPLVAALAWLPHLGEPKVRPVGSRGDGLVEGLRERGLHADPASVRFADAAPGALASRWSAPRAVVRARTSGGRYDVYLVRTRQSPEGALLSVGDAFALSRTSEVEEAGLAAGSGHAAWVVGGERVYRIELVDLGGETLPPGEPWSALARAQHGLTNLQREGQWSGVGRRSFKLDPSASSVELDLGEGGLRAVADGHEIRIPFAAGRAIAGERFVREADRTLARPGSVVTWAVDRARDVSWFGDERMQLTKAVAYRALDVADRALGRVSGGTRVPADDIADLGLSRAGGATDPGTGWPPRPIPPIAEPPLEGEGKWRSLEGDPFTPPSPGPPLLVTTYLRGDRARDDSFVYVVGWDSRLVDLDLVPGTEEPQSATGETGTGRIPRRKEVLSRLIAAFNGGFQSTHGDYGMMAEGEVLVPPRPYAASVVKRRDGTVGFGTWGEDGPVPDDVVAFRQNLTPLVQDGKLNPYKRDWWGGVPHDWEDETRTVRSGLCLTKEGFLFYFYGTRIDHVRLGRIMLDAGCDYGLHLDMNQGHTGLELYRIFPEGELPRLPGKLDGQWKTEGAVEGLPGMRFRGRRLVRNLQLMHFPRYIRRSARDFFYLTARPLLPGARLAVGRPEPGEGEWKVEGLPQHGFPSVLAETSVRPDPARPETKVRLLAIDPTLVRERRGDETAPVVVAAVPGPSGGDSSLWFAERAASIGAEPPPGAAVFARGRTSPGPRASAATCVDGSGKVLYAEVVTAADPARDGALLEGLLGAAGCAGRLFLEAPLELAVGGTRTLSDHPVHLGPGAVAWVRDAEPPARRVFRDTKVLPPDVWTPLQRQTRWFPKAEPSASSAGSADPAPGAAPPER